MSKSLPIWLVSLFFSNPSNEEYYQKISSLDDKMQKREIIEIERFERNFAEGDMWQNGTFLNDDLAKRLLFKC